MTTPDPIGRPSIDGELAEVKAAFVDSRAALDYAYHRGLPRDAIIRTSSPALVCDPDLNAEPVDKHLDSTYGAKLAKATLTFCTDVYGTLRARPETADFAIVVAQLGILFASLMHKAMGLRESDYSDPTAVIDVDAGRPLLDRLYNPPWRDILASNPQLRVRRAPQTVPPSINPRSVGGKVGFLDRQRLGGWEKIGFQLVKKLWQRLPVASPRGTFLVLRENLLLRETALHLVYRGYGLRFISARPDDEPLAPPEHVGRVVRRDVTPALQRFLEPLATPSARRSLKRVFEQRAVSAIAGYEASLPYWREVLDKLAPVRPKAILTNMLMRPQIAALHKVCRERELPLVAFQHGVAREICMTNKYIQAYFEGNTADIICTFSPEAAEVSEASTFNVARAFSVGLPAAYWRCGTYRRARPGAPPILYASTQHYAGNVNMLAGRGYSDIDLAATELRLINEVFGKLPHRVLFKPYPQFRYLDPDPVLACARKAPNIAIYEGTDDLGFLLPDCRVIVTSRATSTVSWCVMSGKPLVFIDRPDQSPLTPSARAAFEAGVFLFDGARPDMHKQLRGFLSQPIESIEAQWVEKASARATLIERFFSGPAPSAGRRSAEILLAHIRDRGLS